MDVFGLLNALQLNLPLPKLTFVVLLGAFFRVRHAVQQSSGKELLGKIVPFVQTLDSARHCSIAVALEEGIVDGLQVFKHELMRKRATAGLGVGMLVEAFESFKPDTVGPAATIGVADGRAVAEPTGDFLQIVSRSVSLWLPKLRKKTHFV